MKTIITAFALLVAGACLCTAQIKTSEETRTETQTSVDSTTGKTVTTSSVTSVSQKADITPRQHMISMNPFKLITMFNLAYHYALTPMIAVGGEVDVPTAVMDNDMTGVMVDLDARIYFGKRPFQGFHLNPYLTVGTLSYRDPNAEILGNDTAPKVHDTPVALGMLMGWHWYPWDDFVTQLAVGAQYNLTATAGENMTSLGSHKVGLWPAGRFTIGYSW